MARTFSVVVLLAFSSTSAFAQYQNSVFVPPYNPGLQLLNDSIRVRPSDDRDSGNGEVRSNRENKANSPTIPANVTYTPSAARTRKNLAKFVAKARVTDPLGADQMEEVFASGDIINVIDGAMQGKGMTASNAADAYAVWWVAAWQAVNNDKRDINSGTYNAVSDQVARGFASSPEFTNSTDAQKQEMAEALLVQAVMIDQLQELYSNDPASTQKLATAIKQGAKESGIDLDKMTLTEQGFAESDGRKTGAASSTDKATNPAANPKGLAANDTGTDAPMSDTGKWAMIAAAGGAGLAGVFMLGKAMGRKG